mgnify:CR=1 FL=1
MTAHARAIAATAILGWLAYVALAWPSSLTSASASSLDPLWLPAGVAVALVIRHGPWIVAVSAAGGLTANLLWGEAGPWLTAAYTAGTALTPLVAGIVFQWVDDPPRVLAPRLMWRAFQWRDSDVPILGNERSALAFLLATLAAGGVGTAWIALFGADDTATAAWGISVVLGVAIVAPAVLVGPRALARAVRARPLESAAIALTLVGVHYAIFVVPVAWTHAAATLAGAPPVVWGALRLGRAGAALVPPLTAAVVLTGTMLNHGPFASFDGWAVPTAYLMVVSAVAWLLGGHAETVWRAESTREIRRRAAETARDRLMELLETTSDFVLTAELDRDRRDIKPLYANNGAWRLLGVSSSRGLTELTLERVYPLWAVRIMRGDAIPTAVDEGIWRGELAVCHAGGHEIPVSQVLVPHRDAGGEVRAVSTIIRDIAGAKETERALRREKAFTDHVVATSPNLVVSICPDGTVRFVNPAVERATGHARESLLGTDWWRTVFHTPQQRGDAERVLANLAEHDELTDQVLTLATRDGTERVVSWSFLRRRGPDGEPIEIIAHGRDITADREEIARQQQQEQLRALGEMAGGMAHELNNALQPVVGLLGVMRDQAGGDATLGRCVDTMETHTLHARRIVTDVLAFARQQGPDVAVFELRGLTREVVDFIGPLMVDSVRLTAEGLDAGPPLDVETSRNGLIQVVQNITNNAVDAMDGKGTIHVAVGAETNEAGEPERARIAITDTGPGMDRVSARNLFNPFYTTKDVGSGTGLGMAVVYGLVTHWNGTIDVDSEPGAGTTITITLPCTAAGGTGGA